MSADSDNIAKISGVIDRLSQIADLLEEVKRRGSGVIAIVVENGTVVRVEVSPPAPLKYSPPSLETR